MNERRVVIAGGGAAGFFAAITCAELCQSARVLLLEKGPQFLSKVRISGGGRCNVTHACFDSKILSTYYPRGGSELLGPFHAFQPRDTIEWFEARGVRLKTESDGRMFPTSDSSATIVDCLIESAEAAGVEVVSRREVEKVTRDQAGRFSLMLSKGERLECDRFMLATGGCRGPGAGALAVALGHKLVPPVPSLFTFQIESPWLRELAGIAVEAEVNVPGTRLRERGPVLVTHCGLSGPAILRISAWGARPLHELKYLFPVRVNWLPQLNAEGLKAELESRRVAHPARLVANTPLLPLPSRLWERLVVAAGISPQTRWANLSSSARHALMQQLHRTEFQVAGKSLNKDEFVTCGGVRLDEVNFKTMESRLCPGLFFGGELLDIDGLTGGFNFQSAWTTGWIAGRAMAT